ncbi:hypothetical protein DNTS_010249 [Danionella cerebrum]|uniref:Calponin-homology (CH) domain-containing protein n=1 Tax=Danionella cerebrum TaxID=2873325 RepID=A0A553P5K7_9TELE|nr:hypothetical protein DNTS_010249 [Danionella translucida]
MNLHLEKCTPHMEVRDLFRDIQDGKILMALLEELSGCKLLHGFKPSSHRIFRLNNIAKVLTFLEERNIKELTGNIKSQFPSSSSLSSIPTSSDSDTSHCSTPSDERKPTIAPRGHGKVIKTLLQWVQRRTRKYGVAVQDFGKSWTSGLAFLAVVKSIDPSLVDIRRAFLQSPRENIEEAFRKAHYNVMLNPPDEQSIMTYVSQFLEHFPGIEEDDTSDLLERSKASTRMNYPVRNGEQKKWESCIVKKESVHPPPKIFVSSVSEDRGQITSPVLSQTPVERPWTSGGSSVGSCPSSANETPVHPQLDLDKNASTTSSPQPSFSDSAINSPDSLGEVLTEMAESHQIIVETENETCAIVEVTSESQFSPETNPGTHLDRDLLIDEGNYSLGSMESLHATVAFEEEESYKCSSDMKDDQKDDSGFFQDSKDVLPSHSEMKMFQDNESLWKDRIEVTDGPEEKPLGFEFDSEPECPVLQFERVSISESEEDLKLCSDLAEDPTEDPGKISVPNVHFEVNEASDPQNGEQAVFLESEDFYKNQDQNQAETKDLEEDHVCYMCGVPVAKSSAEEVNDGHLSHSSAKESSGSEAGGNIVNIPEEHNNEVNIGDIKNEPQENKGICEDLLIIGELENGSDGKRRTEFSHNTSGESQDEFTNNTSHGADEENRPLSPANSRKSVLDSLIKHESNLHDGENPTLSLNATYESFAEFPEKCPPELRLSLSVTPLQPAPPKRSLTESDTDTEDTSEDHGRGFKTRKDRTGSLNLLEQSPFDRHPGEWGTVEPESPTEHYELIKSDEDLTSAGAGENAATLREADVTDESQTVIAVHTRTVVDTHDSKGQNGKALDGIRVDHMALSKSLEGDTTEIQDGPDDTSFSDLVSILLVAWLFIYCLLVLPQMDSRALPKLLFNLEE